MTIRKISLIEYTLFAASVVISTVVGNFIDVNVVYMIPLLCAFYYSLSYIIIFKKYFLDRKTTLQLDFFLSGLMEKIFAGFIFLSISILCFLIMMYFMLFGYEQIRFTIFGIGYVLLWVSSFIIVQKKVNWIGCAISGLLCVPVIILYCIFLEGFILISALLQGVVLCFILMNVINIFVIISKYNTLGGFNKKSAIYFIIGTLFVKLYHIISVVLYDETLPLYAYVIISSGLFFYMMGLKQYFVKNILGVKK